MTAAQGGPLAGLHARLGEWPGTGLRGVLHSTWAQWVLIALFYIATTLALFNGIVFGEKVLFYSDVGDIYLPDFLSTPALWSNSSYSGFPIYAEPNSMTFNPLRAVFQLVAQVANPLTTWNVFAVSGYMVGPFFLHLFAYQRTRDHMASLVAGLVFLASDFLVERMMHTIVLQTLMWVPLLFYALERFALDRARRWLALTAAAFAVAVLSGHTQVAAYGGAVTGLYALLRLREFKAPLTDYISVAVAFLIGSVAALVQVLPTVELMQLSDRSDAMTFSRFVWRALRPEELAAFFYEPAIGVHAERAVYLGVAAIPLVILGMRGGERRAVWFWAGVGLFCVLAAMGDAMPVARTLYQIPLLDRFRVITRLLGFLPMAAGMLSAFAIAALRAGRLGRRDVGIAFVVSLALCLGALLIMLGAADYDGRISFAPDGLLDPKSAYRPFVLLLVACAALSLVSRMPAAGVAVIVALFVFDNAAGRGSGWTGVRFFILDRTVEEPGVHALALRAAAPYQRFLPTGGKSSAVSPPGWGRAWGMPSALGRSVLELDRYAKLTGINTGGGIGTEAFRPGSRALDILAVAHVVMATGPTRHMREVEREGVTWARPYMDVVIAECENGRSTSRPFPVDMPSLTGVAASDIYFYVRTRPCEDDVARVSLLAGPTAALAQSVAQVDVPADGDAVPVSVPAASVAAGSRFWVSAQGASVLLKAVSIRDTAGKDHVSDPFITLLEANPAWRMVRRFDTRLVSDRGVDEAHPDEWPHGVYFNADAQPRAWLVGETLRLPADDMLRAIQSGRLPDGTPYEPARTALLEGEPAEGRQSYAGGMVAVADVSTSEVVLIAEAEGPAFLVLSDIYYPGWSVEIDGQPGVIEPADYVLRGVEIPAGRSVIRFTFNPAVFWIGLAGSLLGWLAIAGLLLMNPARPLIRSASVRA